MKFAEVGRKNTLDIILLRQFQFPVELRHIIVENYFPFLPNEEYAFFEDKNFCTSTSGYQIMLTPSEYSTLLAYTHPDQKMMIVRIVLLKDYFAKYHYQVTNYFLHKFPEYTIESYTEPDWFLLTRYYKEDVHELACEILSWYRNIVLIFAENLEILLHAPENNCN